MNTHLTVRFILAVIVLLAAIAVAVAGNLIVERESRRAAQLAAETALKAAEAMRVADAKSALAALAADEEAVSSYRISDEAIVPFLEHVEADGAMLGAKVTVASVAEGTEEDPRLVLSVRVTGGFDAVMRTLGMIEFGPYDSALQTLTLDTPISADATLPPWTATAVFSIGTASLASTTATIE